jgi:hypothetical protein
MSARRLDTWAWALIYGGPLGLGLGWFVFARDAALGTTLMTAGGLMTAVGPGLIFVRSRTRP